MNPNEPLSIFFDWRCGKKKNIYFNGDYSRFSSILLQTKKGFRSIKIKN